MICLALAILSHNLNVTQENPEKSPILILGQSEQNIDISKIDPKTVSIKELADDLGVDAHEYVVNDRKILISELVLPLTAYNNSTKLLKELAQSDSRTFSSGSLAGKAMSTFFEGLMPGNKSLAKEDDNNFALLLNVSIQDSSNGLKAPVTDQRGQDISQLDAPELRKLDQTDRDTSARQSVKKALPLAPNLFMEASFIVRPLTTKKPTDSENVIAMSEVSIALAKANQDLTNAFQQYKTSYFSLTQSLSKVLADDLSKIPASGEMFSLLPESVQRTVQQHLMMAPQAFGFANENEAKVYLESNPKLKITFNLALFQSYSRKDPRSGELNPTAIGVILNNPNG